MGISVASVTTAHNAARILPAQLEALRNQTRAIQEIIVVDNGSKDGTPQMLRERYPDITALTLNENLGAAGAWSAGISYAALEKRHDWVWTFDDDSVPSASALDRLLEALNLVGEQNPEIGILAAVPVHEPTGTVYRPLLWQDGFVIPEPSLFQRDVWFADLTYASGAMLRREMIEKIGLPRGDFFMDFFDFEYCLRARSQHFRIAVASNAKLSHQIGTPRRVRLPGVDRLWTNYAPWREYYLARNVSYAAWRLYPTMKVKKFVVLHLAKHAAGVILFGSRKFKALLRMAQGFLDGCNGALGIRFRPE